MTVNTSLNPLEAPAGIADAGAEDLARRKMQKRMRGQRLQDFLFHKITLIFALSVLLALMSIIVSLIMGATPAFREFGLAFLTTVEWDPVKTNTAH